MKDQDEEALADRSQSSLDSDEVRETEADLVANLPWKLKNKGLRDVVITIRCGVTIVVHVFHIMLGRKNIKRVVPAKQWRFENIHLFGFVNT